MKTSDFRKQLTSSQLRENMSKMFGMQVTLEKYSREQLEDMRNKLRTRMFQHEGQAGINDLLTNETYQKDKAMLALLNTRIKEMLGEDIKKLKDKMVELSEAKKGVRAPKFVKKAKGTSGADKDGDGKKDFDDVQVARMTAGGVPKKTAIAKATSDKFNEAVKDKVCPKCGEKQHTGKCAVEEGWDEMQKDVDDRASKEKKEKGTGKFDKKQTTTGTKYTRKPETFNDGGKDKDMKKAEKKTSESVVAEKTLTGAEKKKKEEVVKSMKKDKAGFKKRYGGRGEEVMHATATKIAKKKANESLLTYRRHVKLVNESLGYLLQEDEEEKAAAITAAGDMANDFTSWMQRVGQYQTKVMIELSDEIRHNFGQAEAEAFKQAVSPALAATLETLTTQREAISGAIAALAGGQAPMPAMGAEPAPEMPMEPAAPDEMNTPPADEFAASDAAAGAGTPGREMRESRFVRKLAESHSIISKLAR